MSKPSVAEERLAVLLYVLSRDEVTWGKIEAILENHIDACEGRPVFSHDDMGRWARDTARRVLKGDELSPL